MPSQSCVDSSQSKPTNLTRYMHAGLMESTSAIDERRAKALADFRKTLLQHKEVDGRVRRSTSSCHQAFRLLFWMLGALCSRGILWQSAVREELKKLRKDYDKTEDDLKSLQSVGQIIGEVLRHLEEDKCTTPPPPDTHSHPLRPSPRGWLWPGLHPGFSSPLDNPPSAPPAEPSWDADALCACRYRQSIERT